MALSYIDKAIIFLLPLIVLYFFKDKTVYVSIEYIYSVTIVLIPLLDLGLSGYFFFAYRNSEDCDNTIKTFVEVFQRLYILLSVIGVGFIAFNYLGIEFEKFIIFIVSRLLFVLCTTFLASYYRLTNKPQNVVYITIFFNALSLLFILAYFLIDSEFSLWLIFIGQILFAIFYLFKSVRDVFFAKKDDFHNSTIKKLIVKAFLYSWPIIIQAFIMMYISNYGKLNALTKMTIDDGVLLSLTQRFSMVIFLTHSALWAYLIKDVYVEGNLLVISKNILYKYLSFLSVALFMVAVVTGVYVFYNFSGSMLTRSIFISCLIIGQTFFSCIFAYLELHYGRENKNIINLYLAIFSAIIFVSLLTFLKTDFLIRIVIAMFVSTFAALLLSIFVLHKRKYKIV